MDQQDKVTQRKNPRENAGFLSICFFWWMNSLLGEGYKKELELEDLYEARKEDESEILGDRLEKEWMKEVSKATASKSITKESYSPSLAKAMIRTFGPYYAFLGTFTFVEECFIRIFQPLFMGWMIEYFTPGSTMSLSEVYLYGTGVVMMSAVYTFTHHPYFFGVMHTGMKVRVASCSVLYRKALRLSNSALGQTTVGQMVNLLSNDVNRFDLSVLFLHYLWAGPVQLLIVTTILCLKIGPSALVGAVLLIAAVPLQTWVGKQFGKLRVRTAGKTDKRIRLMNEIVNGMKVIKMYTWEKPFASHVHDARKEEIGVVKKTSYYRAFNFSFFFTASRFILLCTFLVFGFTGEVLTAEKAFLCLSMFNTVRLSMTLFFPFAISQLGETRVSVKRIQDFLLMEEREEQEGERDTFAHDDANADTVTMEKVTGKWKKDENEDTLTNIDLNTKPGQLIAIIGPVGSGKSSIIQAILGELPTSSGKISVSGNLSYAPQEAWVFSGSVRQNILFGRPFQEEHYWKVIEACALKHDMEQWEFGDKTLVGERGVALSGGQKARVTLARAIYRDADTYLLDDPLSAVDAHVGKHLFQNCIQGFLEKKAVILVTHQLQYLQEADEIIVLKQGRVEERGSFQHLLKNGMDFSSFLAQDGEEEENDDDFSQDKDEETTLLPKKPFPRIRTMSIRSDTRSVVSDVSQATALSDVKIKTGYDLIQGEEIDEKKESPKQVKEQRSSGSVKFKIYTDYFRSGGNWFAVIFMFFMNILCQVLYSGSDIWLSFWTGQEEKKLMRLQNIEDQELPSPVLTGDSVLTNETSKTIVVEDPDLSEHYFNLGIYGAIVGALVVTSMIRTVYFFFLCMRSSVNLHDRMFESILRAPCRFFDTNPVGRILNRFSKDMGSMDELLPPAFFDVLTIGLNIFGIMAVIFAVRPWVMIPTAVLGVVFVLLRRFYMASARDIKRIEGIARSPVFSQLSTSLQGLTTIRAFSAQPLLRAEFDRQQDLHSSAWFAFISATRWFGVWLDWIVVVYLGLVVYSFLVLGGDLFGGEVGLAISNCIMLTGMLQWGVRQSAEVENLMTSVERVMEYSQLEEEDDPTKEDNKPPSDWPKEGVIEFKDVYLRYAKEEKEVLKGLNFKTNPCEKIGIVGRTGAGKSSLVTALFRLAEPSGSIKIDGIEVLKLGLHDLRSKLSIIPQDPLLFTGSLRRNLDPFQEHTDDQVWKVLQEVHLSEAVSDLKSGLETEMSEGGSNFSVGQRQLVCLARAILRQNSILVLDEATANVDPRTDSLIQEQIRTRFRDCTVLTIAHRLHTIMDSDRILVLADGQVVEHGQPYELLCDKDGVLTELAEQTGAASKDRLLEIARTAYFQALHKTEEDQRLSQDS